MTRAAAFAEARRRWRSRVYVLGPAAEASNPWRFYVRWSGAGVVMRRYFADEAEARDFASRHTCLGERCVVVDTMRRTGT